MIPELSGEPRAATAGLMTVLALRRVRSGRGHRPGSLRSLLAASAHPGVRRRSPTPVLTPSVPAAPVPRRVLCTDRDAMGAESLARSFRTAGFDARGCADGATALVEVTEFRPHACVLDLDTPGIGGCELAQWVRSAVGGLTFLIAVADRLGDDLDRVATDAGFDLLLARPADAGLVIGLLGGHRCQEGR